MGTWEYHYDNICVSDNVVATFTNDKGTKIYEVYEGRTSYIAQPQVEFLHGSFIDYSDVKETKEEREKCASSIEVLGLRLRKACSIIETLYNEQVNRMKELF